MTAASATPATSSRDSRSRDMGGICAARSKVDSILGAQDENGPGHDPRLPGTPRFDRTAMIELRKARGRWNADDLDIDYEEPVTGGPGAGGEAPTLAIETGPIETGPIETGPIETGPIEIAVLDLPSFDAAEAAAVRDEAAHLDRALKLARLARSAGRLRAQLDAIASGDAEGAGDAEPEAEIDLREGAHEAVAVTEHEATAATEPADLQGIVATIRKLASLRDEGLLTDAEFDAKMSDLLARV